MDGRSRLLRRENGGYYGYKGKPNSAGGVFYPDPFLKSDAHEGIYGYWVDRPRGLNIVIKYIPNRRNKVADGLSRTLFYSEDCGTDENVKEATNILRRAGAQWIGKDGKNGYEAFLARLNAKDRE